MGKDRLDAQTDTSGKISRFVVSTTDPKIRKKLNNINLVKIITLLI